MKRQKEGRIIVVASVFLTFVIFCVINFLILTFAKTKFPRWIIPIILAIIALLCLFTITTSNDAAYQLSGHIVLLFCIMALLGWLFSFVVFWIVQKTKNK